MSREFVLQTDVKPIREVEPPMINGNSLPMLDSKSKKKRGRNRKTVNLEDSTQAGSSAVNH